MNQIEDMFAITPSEYWKTHYVFDKESVSKNKALGKNAIESIIINTIVPVLFAYSKTNAKYKELAMQYLLILKPENNNVIRGWNDCGVQTKNAYTTQALLHLKQNYCTPKKCLSCTIGNYILKN